MVSLLFEPSVTDNESATKLVSKTTVESADWVVNWKSKALEFKVTLAVEASVIDAEYTLLTL